MKWHQCIELYLAHYLPIETACAKLQIKVDKPLETALIELFHMTRKIARDN